MSGLDKQPRKPAGSATGAGGQYDHGQLRNGVPDRSGFQNPFTTDQINSANPPPDLPTHTDTRLVGLLHTADTQEHQRAALETSLRWAAGQKQQRIPGSPRLQWSGTLNEALNQADSPSDQEDLATRYRQCEEGLRETGAHIAECHRIHEQWGWTRAWLVVSSPNGHVHKDLNCPTCFPTTEYVLLPEYSGSDEGAIVTAAGQRCCTTCWPSAPAETLKQPSKIKSPAEKTAAQEKAKKVEQAAAKRTKAAANAPTANGEPLTVVSDRSPRADGTLREYREVFKTERAALSWAADVLSWRKYLNQPATDAEQQGIQLIVESVADKHGTSVGEIVGILEKKAAAKFKRDYR